MLATAIFVALDPFKRLADARNAQRWQATNTILDAVKLYQTDNGALPAGIDTTLHMLGTDIAGCNVSCGGFSSANTANSQVDDTQTEFDAGTHQNTQWSIANAWLELNAAGLISQLGTYTSTILDATNTATWDTLSFTPQQPYGKELPANGQAESGYTTGNADMTSNVLLMHLNEASGTIVDSSGQSNHGTKYGVVTYGITGQLNTGLTFNGTSGYVAIQNLHYNAVGQIPQLTVCSWFKTTFGGSTWTTNWALVDFDRSEYYNLFVYGDTGELGFSTAASGSGIKDMRGITVVNDGQWHFGCGVFNAAITNDKMLYVDGVLDKQVNAYATGLNLGTGLTRYGFLGEGSEATTFNGSRNGIYYSGSMDEVMIFHRALTATEILAIYKRGANRLKMQVRSCNDAACAGESFIGPDGTAATYYSELNNTTVSPPTLTMTNVTNNRYFQSKTTLETDHSSYTPALKSLTINYTTMGVTPETTVPSCLDLTPTLAYYLPNIPKDPKNGSTAQTHYGIKQSSSSDSVTVVSCSAEQNQDISKNK